MATAQDQYTDALRTGQDAMTSMVDSWTKAATQAFGTVPSVPFTPVDPAALVDQAFNFASKVLETQHQFVKNLTEVSMQMGDTIREQAESATDATARSARQATKK